ncbi:DoxX family protein [Simkania negevensis]|uniref:DoxX family protein n=1 Tax=Simkania negevensis TaxID=83561 RepID=A0ABS3ARA8_9BACT|nr:DoxX family protein [Simkania negevensis]
MHHSETKRRNYLAKFSALLQTPALLLIRIIWGVLFILEGWHKFADISGTASFFQELGFTYPTLMVLLTASVELLGGILLLVGFFTRIAAIFLIITMIIAAIMAPSHAHFLGYSSGQTETFLAQIPLTFAYACFVTFLFGAGKWSLDHRITKKISPYFH